MPRRGAGLLAGGGAGGGAGGAAVHAGWSGRLQRLHRRADRLPHPARAGRGGCRLGDAAPPRHPEHRSRRPGRGGGARHDGGRGHLRAVPGDRRRSVHARALRRDGPDGPRGRLCRAGDRGHPRLRRHPRHRLLGAGRGPRRARRGRRRQRAAAPGDRPQPGRRGRPRRSGHRGRLCARAEPHRDHLLGRRHRRGRLDPRHHPGQRRPPAVLSDHRRRRREPRHHRPQHLRPTSRCCSARAAPARPSTARSGTSSSTPSRASASSTSPRRSGRPPRPTPRP